MDTVQLHGGIGFTWEHDAHLYYKNGLSNKVLLGGPQTLARACLLQLELSLVPLYAGQKLLPELIEVADAMGFDLWGVFPVFADPASGRMLQVDGIFCRRQ